VRDEKMLENLATHNVQDVSKIFSLADKCTRAVEGHVWHSQPALEAGKAGKPNANGAAQSSSKRKKKRAGNKDKMLAGAPTSTAAAAGGGRGPCGSKRPRQLSVSHEGDQWCPVHNSKRHNIEECWEIKKLAKQFCEQLNCYSHTAMAHLPDSGRASRRSSQRVTRMRRWCSRTSRGCSRSSMATLTLTPVPMSTKRLSTSSTTAPGTSHVGVLISFDDNGLVDHVLEVGVVGVEQLELNVIIQPTQEHVLLLLTRVDVVRGIP
jgi:hypothetical protein